MTPNLDQLRRSVHEPPLRELFEQASLSLADGTTLLWASRLQGTPLPERVPGSTLIFTLTAAAARHGLSVFFLGGDPGVADRAAARFVELFPTLRVAGTWSPPFGFERAPRELQRISDVLQGTHPRLVYVCLGFPKQEHLIQNLRVSFPQVWFLGLGVSLSFVAEDLVRAPAWVQRLGLEWLHRLVQEPRLFERFVLRGIPFSLRLFAEAARARLQRKNRGRAWEPSQGSQFQRREDLTR